MKSCGNVDAPLKDFAKCEAKWIKSWGSEGEKGELSLYTEDGKLLQQFSLNEVKDSFTINIKAYTPGNYMLIIKDCFGNNQTVKITKYR